MLCHFPMDTFLFLKRGGYTLCVHQQVCCRLSLKGKFPVKKFEKKSKLCQKKSYITKTSRGGPRCSIFQIKLAPCYQSDKTARTSHLNRTSALTVVCLLHPLCLIQTLKRLSAHPIYVYQCKTLHFLYFFQKMCLGSPTCFHNGAVSRLDVIEKASKAGH